jgi:hypothetical protein
MNTTRHLATKIIGSISCAALLATLTGCVSHVGGPPHGSAYAQPPPAYVESGVVVQPEYVYYPGYQVYYTRNTRQYVYLEGRSWVSRPAPPLVSADVLFASPSVRLDFHDSPAIHHASVVRQQPKHWAPPGSSPNLKQCIRHAGRREAPKLPWAFGPA